MKCHHRAKGMSQEYGSSTLSSCMVYEVANSRSHMYCLWICTPNAEVKGLERTLPLCRDSTARGACFGKSSLGDSAKTSSIPYYYSMPNPTPSKIMSQIPKESVFFF
ncbi:hypothetical protein KIL84_020016 [Mauremys mutica]|uniref:Uncharacterized protein n=1 Tax=Mauremys mutica TaxID=74926 RepID=A0A9D3XWD1_9SAUR|nr:hypothetical protein KIL84_020016 [Mauremys mutica]